MFRHADSQTRILAAATVILGLGFVLVAVWGGISLAPSSSSPLATHVVIVVSTQRIVITKALTPIMVRTLNATEIAVEATQRLSTPAPATMAAVATERAKFDNMRKPAPTLPTGSGTTAESSRNPAMTIAWLIALTTLAILLVITALTLRARLHSAKQ